MAPVRTAPSWPLFTTRGATSYLDHDYRRRGILMFGRESAGVPDRVARGPPTRRLAIPVRDGTAVAQYRDGLRHGGRRSDPADAAHRYRLEWRFHGAQFHDHS